MVKKILYLIPLSLLLITGCTEPVPNKDGVKISGKISFDRVPSAIEHGGIAKLDYSNIKKVPAKEIVVKAIGKDGKAVAQTVTDKQGNYTLYVKGNSDIKIRAYARMFKKGFWDVSVVDNTNMKSIYVMEGGYHNSGNKNNIRNLNASSGWGGTGYTKPRVAAPFAILDSINQAMTKVRDADPDAIFPQLTVNWSVNNIAAAGDPEAGMIITSNYDGERGLWILGDENSDTDEYDDHIIIHEWGHYFEDQFSRTDSIGGPHGTGEALDIRLAFGEGWGNALSGIVTDNPIYFDTSGAGQSYGWYMDLESGAQKNPGWYSEGSVQRILYDIYDSTNEAHDHSNLGFKPIYKAMVGKERNAKAFTSLFTFIDALKSENPSKKRGIDKTVAYEQINTISDPYGSNRTNRGNSQYTIPVYRDLRVGGTITACTRNNYGAYNKLGNRTFVKMNIPKSGNYTINAQLSDGSYGDPDIALYKTAYPHENIAISMNEGSPTDVLSTYLEEGEYLLDVYDNSFSNSCSLISLRRDSANYSKPNKGGSILMKSGGKPVAKRVLPKRQYY